MKLPPQIKDARKYFRWSRTHYIDTLEVVITRAGGMKALSEKTGIPYKTICSVMNRQSIGEMDRLCKRLEAVK